MNKPKHRKYSAMTELVGQRELAAYNPNMYMSHMGEIFSSLDSILAEKKFDEIKLYIFLDKCIFISNSLELLIELLVTLRSKLLSFNAEKLLLRGALMEAEVVFTPAVKSITGEEESDRIFGHRLNDAGAELFGRLERLKGIGIMVDASVYHKAPKKIKDLCMLNFFVSETTGSKYGQFFDLRLRSSDVVANNLGPLLVQFEQARHRSNKIARFFVPFLANWIENQDWSEDVADEASIERPLHLDIAVCFKRLNGLRTVSGYELFFWRLVNKVYQFNDDNVNPRRKTMLEAFFAKSRWLYRLMRIDGPAADLPESLCSHFAQENFRRLLALETSGVRREKSSTS